MVDEVFNKLHKQNKMSWATKGTPFAFPIFVVWKIVFVGPDKAPHRKGRVVVDIRGLNKITTPDAYSIPRQEEITAVVASYKYIIVTNSLSFFY